MISFLKKIISIIASIKNYLFYILTIRNFLLYIGSKKNRKFYDIINLSKIRKFIKKSNTVVIYGTGSSINKINKNEFKKLEKFNSISLGHFAEHAHKKKIEINIIHIKEIGAWGDIIGNSQLENVKEVVNYIDGVQKLKSLKKSIFLLQTGISGKCSNFILDNCMLPFKSKVSFYKSSEIFNNSDNFTGNSLFLNGYCGSLSMAVSFAIKLGWKNIILAGIDLDDNRYFYLDKNQTALWNNKRNIKVNDPHSMKIRTIKYLTNLSKWSKTKNVNLFVMNKKNILGKILPNYDL